MSCHAVSDFAPANGPNIILVGNHNVGKSLIFGWLTGRYVTVANYPGTTVEITRGVARSNERRPVIDTPGVNSLEPISEDERVTRDVLLDEGAHAVVQVADAKNLRRALLITTQLAELELPLVLTLNMMDEAQSRHVRIDVTRLSEKVGARVITATATKRDGLLELAEAIEQPTPAHALVHFDEELETGITEIAGLLRGAGPSPRALASMFLSGEKTLDDRLYDRLGPDGYGEIAAIRQRLQQDAGQPLSSVIQNARVQWADQAIREVYAHEAAAGESISSVLGRWSVHPVWGIPILLLVMFLLYEFVGHLGAGILVNFIEGTLFGQWINPFVTQLVHSWLPLPFLQDFLVGKYGIINVALTYGFAIILPIVFTFFIAFGILEDSGYLPRLAVVANRVFTAMGLNGKAVLPMVLGLGCDTMATMTTRTLETKKDRVLVTLLLALGVPCSAQLGVVLGMLAGLDPRATFLWLGVVTGVLLVVGWLAARLIPGDSSDFILELPPLRLPKLSHLLVKTLARMEWYLREVLPLFVLGTVVLFILNELGVLGVMEKAAEPLVVNWLGLPPQASEMFLIGFLRRDYGAAGFFVMARQGLITPNQIIVALVTITLFVPCIANFFVMVRERGARTALAITAFIFPFAFAVGGLLNLALSVLAR